MNIIVRIVGGVVAFQLLVAAPAAGATKRLGTFGAWDGYVVGEKKSRLCYLHGVPKISKGKYTKRDNTFIQITHRPPRTKGEVSITAGYTYRKDSEVEVEIDGTKFEMFTNKDTAWSRDAQGDAALVKAMRAGQTMIVRGTSARGTLTADTYSLGGFTAGHEAINKACGVK
jgi:hypothetical protein